MKIERQMLVVCAVLAAMAVAVLIDRALVRSDGRTLTVTCRDGVAETGVWDDGAPASWAELQQAGVVCRAISTETGRQ